MRYPIMFFSILAGFVAFALVTGAPIIGAIIIGLLIYRISAKIRTRYRRNYIVDKQYEAIKKQEQKEKKKENETEYDFRL